MRRHASFVLTLLISLISAFVFAPRARAGGAIASGSTLAGNLTGPGYSETWTFSGNIGDHVLFTVMPPNGSVATQITLKAPGGSIATQTPARRLDFQLTGSGTWTIVVDDLTAGVPTSYQATFLDLSSTLTSGGDADGGPITSNQILTGSTNVASDLDAYSFSGTVGDRIVMTIVPTSGASYTPTIYLYPPGGGSYVTATTGRLDYQLAASGTFVAVVQDNALLNTGSFTISYLNVTAGPLTTGGDTDGGPIASGSIKTGAISGAGDLDAFTFTGSTGDHVLLGDVTTAGHLNTNMTLYPPGGGAAITASSADRLDAQLTANGTWTVVVEDYADAQAGSYSLSVMDLSSTLTSGSDLDGGAIASNQILTGTANGVGDFDAYTFTGTIGNRVLMTVAATGGASYTPQIYLYPPGGGTYVTTTLGRLDYQLTSSGTFTVIVQDQTLLNTGTYELSYFNVTSGPYTDGSDADGGPIASGSGVTGTVSGPGDFDAFTFTGTTGDHVILASLTTAGVLNTNVTLYPPGGGAAITSTSADRLDAQLTATGTWTVVMEDYANVASGTYSLSLIDLNGTTTAPGDLDGGPITSNQILTGTTNGIGDFDAFTFSGVSGSRVVLTAIATSGAAYSPSVYLYPPGGGTYITSATNGRVEYRLTSSGTFTAVVQDVNLVRTGTYALSYFNITAGPLTSAGDTDGGPIASGSIKSGTISGPGDLDAFTFSGSDGDHVILEALTSSGALNTNMTLYPPGGGVALTGTSGDRLDAQLNGDGLWTVVIEDYSDVSSGAYSLSVTDLSSTLTSPGDADGGWIASNQILTGTSNVAGDLDAFTFNGVSGDRIVMNLVSTSGLPYKPYVYLYPPGGGTYVTSSPGKIDYQLTSTGIFTAVVQDAYYFNTGTYALSYLDVSAGYLNGSGDTDGSVIKPGDVRAGTIAGPGDFDAYWFTGNSGETAHLNCVATSGTLNTEMTVYPPDGTAAVIYTSTDDVSFPLGQTGRYAVVIEDYSDKYTGTYQLSLTGSLTTVGVPDPGGPKVLDPTHVVFTSPMPNPARGPETLTFSLPTAMPVQLNVYDTRGALVRTLDHGTEVAGIYARVWDGTNDRGDRVPAGVYFSELRAGGQTFKRALVRLE